MMPFDIRIMRSLGIVTKRNGQYIVVGQPNTEPLPQVAVSAPLPTFFTPAPASSSVPPPAPQTPSSAPSPQDSDPTDAHLTLSEIQHIQRFQGAQLSWLIQGFQHLCQTQGISLPPPPEFHNFDTGDDSSGDGTEPLPDNDQEDIDNTSTDP